MARSWGFWTRYKLELLQRYPDSFTTTTKNRSPTKRVYLDLFGGEPDNVDRDTQDPIDGSARIALNTKDPPFSHLRFFELGAERHEAAPGTFGGVSRPGLGRLCR